MTAEGLRLSLDCPRGDGVRQSKAEGGGMHPQSTGMHAVQSPPGSVVVAVGGGGLKGGVYCTTGTERQI